MTASTLHKLSDSQYQHLLWAQSDDSPYDLRIPIPADGWEYPDFYCYQKEGQWYIEQRAIDFCTKRGFAVFSDEV